MNTKCTVGPKNRNISLHFSVNLLLPSAVCKCKHVLITATSFQPASDVRKATNFFMPPEFQGGGLKDYLILASAELKVRAEI